MNRPQLKLRYRRLFSATSALLFRHDPLGINGEANTDEYEPEVGTILPRLRECSTADDALRVVHEEFVRWFGETAGPQARYRAIAEEIWKLWLALGPVDPEPSE